MAGEGASVGTVYVEINPRATAFWDKFVAQARPGANKAGDEIGAAVGRQLQDKVSGGLARGVEAGAAAATTRGAKVGKDIGDAARKGIESALKALPEAKLDADSSKIDRKVAAIRADLATLKDQKIGVDLDAGEAQTRLAALSRQLGSLTRDIEAAKAAGKNIPLNVDSLKALAAVDALKRKVAEFQRDASKPVKVPVEADTAKMGQLEQLIDRRIGGAIKALPNVELSADSSEAEAKVAKLRRDLESLQSKRIGVDLSAEQALAEIGRINRELSDLGSSSESIQVRADTAAASAQLATVEAEVARLAGSNPTVRVDVDAGGAAAQLGAVNAAASGSSGSIGTLIAAGLAIGPAIIPVAAAATAAIAAIGAAAVAGGIGIGVGVLAFTGVTKAVQAMGAAHEEAGKSAASNAAKTSQIASAVAQAQSATASLANTRASAASAEISASQRVAQAEQRLQTARSDAAQAAVAAAERVAGAVRSLAVARRTATSAQLSSERAVTSAEQSLTAAQNQARISILALTDAKKAAKQANDDLATSIAHHALATRQAALDEESARTALAKLNTELAGKTDAESQQQRAQAKLNYDEAKQRVLDLGVQQQRLAEQKAESDRAGIDGSKQVLAAQETIAAASERVRKAEAGVSDARSDSAAQAQRSAELIAAAEAGVGIARQAETQSALKSTATIGAAEQAIADARRGQADQARQAAFSIAQAQQAVVSAQQQVQQASQDAGSAGSASMDKLATAMAGLSPAGREFATFIFGLKGTFDDLRRTAEAGVLPGVQAGIEALLPKLPMVKALVADVGKVLGDMAKSAGEALASPKWEPFFAFVSSTAGPALKGMGDVVGNVALAFANLMVAFGPLTEKFGGGLVGMSEKFAAWAAGLSNNPSFNKFLDYIAVNGAKVVDLGGKIAEVVGKIVTGLAPIGSIALTGLTGFFDMLSSFSTAQITAIAVGIAAVAAGFAVYSVGAGIATAATKGFGAAMAATPVGLIVTLLAGLVIGVIAAYNHFGKFREFVDAAWAGIKSAAVSAWEGVLKPAFNGLKTAIMDGVVPAVLWLWHNAIEPAFVAIGAVVVAAWNNVIKPAFEALKTFVSTVLGPAIMWLRNNAVVPAFEGIKSAISVAWAAIKVVFDVINTFIRTVLGPVFTWLWNNIVQPAWTGIKAVIDVAWAAINVIFGLAEAYIRNVLAPVFMWLWNNVITPVWAGIKLAIDVAWAAIKAIFGVIETVVRTVLAPVFTWLWNAVITPVWAGIKLAIDIAWTAIKIIFGLVEIYIKAVLAPVFTWLWNSVITPVWNGIKAAIDLAWKGILVIWTAIKWQIDHVLAPVFRFLLDKVITPIWNGIKDTISAVWDKFIKPTFTALADFIGNHVVPGFRAGVDAIGKAWEGVKELARKPVEFVVNSVINPLIRGYNSLATKFGVGTVGEIQGFATGGIAPAYSGVIPGYTPGRDTQLIAVGGGEAILRPEVTRALGPSAIHEWNAAARSGGVAGAAKAMGIPGFAVGGIVGSVLDGVANPGAWLRRQYQGAVGKLGQYGDLGKMLANMPENLVNGMLGLVKGMLARVTEGSGGTMRALGAASGAPPGAPIGPTGSGWAWQIGRLRQAFPGLALYSGLRPGAVTSSGNASWHSKGRAVDIPPRKDVFDWILSNYGSRSKELISKLDPAHNIYNGQYHRFSASLLANHGLPGEPNAHIHWAYDQGGPLPPGLTMAYNGTGKTEWVFTEDQLKSMAAGGKGGGGGPTVNINVNGSDQSPREIAQQVKSELAWAMR